MSKLDQKSRSPNVGFKAIKGNFNIKNRILIKIKKFEQNQKERQWFEEKQCN